MKKSWEYARWVGGNDVVLDAHTMMADDGPYNLNLTGNDKYEPDANVLLRSRK